MGRWGTGIYQNDVAEDVKNLYIGYLKSGKSDDEALQLLLDEFENEINDSDDSLDFFFALADIMWKKGRLTEKIKKIALNNIDIDLNSCKWETKTEHRQRAKKLEELRKRLESPMPERKKVPIHKPYKIGLNVNDLYYYHFPDKIEKWATYSGERFAEQYGKYAGKYIVIYIEEIIEKDWQVPTIPDEMAICRCFIVNNIPDAKSFLDNAVSLDCKYKWLESSPRNRAKELTYFGNLDIREKADSNFPLNDYMGYIVEPSERELEKIIRGFTFRNDDKEE